VSSTPASPGWQSLAAPLAFAAAAAWLTGHVTDRPEEAAAMARGIAGPTTWPTVMLWLVAALSLIWAVQRLATLLRAKEGTPPVDLLATAATGGWQVWLGIVLVMAYGFSLPILGFAVATVSYMLLWLVLGGVRSTLQLLLIPLIGTVVMMYVFLKLALMPLDRGIGAIGEFSIWLYRVLGIY